MKLFTRTDSTTMRQTTRLFLQFIKADKRQVALFSTLIPLGQAVEFVVVPLLLSLITQTLIVHPEQTTYALWLVAGIAVCALVSLVTNHVGFILMFRHEENVSTKLLRDGLSGILSHSQAFLSNRKVGALAGDVYTFSRSYMNIVDTIFLQMSGTAVSFIVSLVVIAIISPILLIPLAGLTLVIVYLSIVALNKRAPYRNKRKDLQSKLSGHVADVIANHSLVRLYGQQARELAKTKQARSEIMEIFEKEVSVIQHEADIRRVILFGFQVATMILCIVLFSKSLLSVSALVFAITYLGRVTGSMFTITSGIRTIEQAYLDAAKTTELLMTKIDVVDAPDSEPLLASSATIVFRDVTFAYQDAKSQHVFTGLNLTIPAGQHVGLVGHSGGGKSTLSSLLLRYMDIEKGQILIDGQDIAKVTQTSLRNLISYVPQDPSLFHRTLRENIAYGKPDATDTEIMRAVKQANASEFIKQLPHGLGTVVGERGVKLSGGQRQRVAIARALLKDAPILLLDEATSALDSESEKLIQEALATLMSGRTSIVIAHRLSTIAKLDRIIVLDHGKIVEDGTHRELLDRDGTYAKLWKHQSGGFIEG